MVNSYKKSTDIESLEKLMLELGVEIDLRSDFVQGYDTPDYNFIK